MKCKKYNQIKCGFEFDGNCILRSSYEHDYWSQTLQQSYSYESKTCYKFGDGSSAHGNILVGTLSKETLTLHIF